MVDTKEILWKNAVTGQQGLTGTLYLTDEEEKAKDLIHRGLAVLGVDRELKGAVPSARYVCEDPATMTDEELSVIYCRLHYIPLEVMRLTRVSLRECGPEDVPALQKIYEDEEVARFSEALYPPEEEKAYARQYMDCAYGFYGYGMWLITDNTDGKVIGRGGIEKKENPVRQEDLGVELGFLLAKEARGKGYMKEVIPAILRFAGEELKEPLVYAVVRKENVPSLQLLLSLGFRAAGEFTKDGYDCTYLEYLL